MSHDSETTGKQLNFDFKWKANASSTAWRMVNLINLLKRIFGVPTRQGMKLPGSESQNFSYIKKDCVPP